MQFTERLKRLGTETAYAVAMSAAEYAAKGKKVYPFHLGDMNLGTPENIVNAAKVALDNGKTGYCAAAGIKELREALAEDISKSHGIQYTWENVSIQPGGKPVIGKFLQIFMNEGDEVLYPTPGYPIYESMVEYYGGVGKPYTYIETDEGYKMDMEYFKSLITPNTKCLIYNNYQNPMGVTSSNEEMEEIAKLAVENDLYVLADEAYFDMVYDITPKSIVSFPGMKERSIILYTFAKKFAMTGWRLGGAIGPKEPIDYISKINTNDEACTNHFVQWAGVEALKGDQNGPKQILNVLQERRDVLVDILSTTPGVKVYKPNATFYLFVNVTEVMEKMGIDSVEEFRLKMIDDTGVSFCTREHFGRSLPSEKQKYIRFAYSGIEVDQIREGMTIFKKYIEEKVYGSKVTPHEEEIGMVA